MNPFVWRWTRSVFLLLVLSVSIPDYTLAQDRALSTLSLLNAGEVIVNSQENLLDSEEFRHVVDIYNKLVNARGDFRNPVPSLTMTDVEGRVATINYNKNIINLEKKAYDIVSPFGDAAIAFLLSHELTHYYERHAWRPSFANTAAHMDCGKSVEKLQFGVIQESEADYLGGFLAYSAGFGMFDKGGEIISSLYEGYNMPDTSAQYPSKAVRIELARKTAKKIASLVDVFDMANYLFVTNQRAKAYKYYEYILKSYKSRELYNNLAVGGILDAMAYMDSTEIKWSYPLVLDVVLNGSRSIEDKQVAIQKALEQVQLQCNAAINLDPNYVPAYLNKSIAYALQNDIDKAEFYLLKEALPRAEAQLDRYGKTLTDIQLMRGILLAKRDKKNKAIKVFKPLAEKGNALAERNLNVAKGANVPFSSQEQKKVDLKTDKIGSMSVATFASDPESDGSTIAMDTDNNLFFKFAPEDGKSIFLGHQETDADDDLFLFAFQKTAPGYTGSTTSGIKIGSTLREVVVRHGQPKTTLDTVEGRLMVYDSVIFILDIDKGVTRWITYAKDIL